MKEIIVFTTNTLGQHTNAAAKLAYKKHGARWGMAYGHYGNSFAIPVRDGNGNRIKEGAIYGFIEGFIAYASANPQWDFKVMSNDYLDPYQFINVTGNVLLPEAWRKYLGDAYNYWGTSS